MLNGLLESLIAATNRARQGRTLCVPSPSFAFKTFGGDAAGLRRHGVHFLAPVHDSHVGCLARSTGYPDTDDSSVPDAAARDRTCSQASTSAMEASAGSRLHLLTPPHRATARGRKYAVGRGFGTGQRGRLR